LDVIDTLTTVERSSFHARLGRLTAKQDVEIKQATMTFRGFSLNSRAPLGSKAIRRGLLPDARQRHLIIAKAPPTPVGP
jgi:hypothetical protein